MITVLQRVTEARVSVCEDIIGIIDCGLMVLVGIDKGDSQLDAENMVQRLLSYRVFADSEGKMNLSLADTKGGLLLVPQFTLAANTKKGRRPSFTSAAPPDEGENIFNYMVDYARHLYAPVANGQFGADMQVALVNDGPVTFILTST